LTDIGSLLALAGLIAVIGFAVKADRDIQKSDFPVRIKERYK